MKNARIQPLIILTCIFISVVVGLFISRTQDHAPVHIQRLPPHTDLTITATSAADEPGIVNINTATVEELQALPGIGETLAERIVAYRTTYGAFESVGALVNVEGIGEIKLETIWDLVTIGG